MVPLPVSGHTSSRAFILIAVVSGLMIAGCGGGSGSTSVPPPTQDVVITTQPASQSVPIDRAATFTVAATGTAPLSYQWSKNGVEIARATAASYTTPDVSLADSGSSFVVTRCV